VCCDRVNIRRTGGRGARFPWEFHILGDRGLRFNECLRVRATKLFIVNGLGMTVNERSHRLPNKQAADFLDPSNPCRGQNRKRKSRSVAEPGRLRGLGLPL